MIVTGVGDGSASLDHEALKAKWVEAFNEIKESASESESMVEELSEGAAMVPAGQLYLIFRLQFLYIAAIIFNLMSHYML